MNRQDLVEYFWDERSGVAEFIYEDDQTGELSLQQIFQPLVKPALEEDAVYEATRNGYFANLQFWLDTQPLYD